MVRGACLVLALVIVVLGMALGACGGSGNDPKAYSDYLGKIFDARNAIADDIQKVYKQSKKEWASGDYDTVVAALKRGVSRVEAIEPPPEMAEAHAALVKGNKREVRALRKAANKLGRLTLAAKKIDIWDLGAMQASLDRIDKAMDDCFACLDRVEGAFDDWLQAAQDVSDQNEYGAKLLP